MNIYDINLRNSRAIIKWCSINLGMSKYRKYSKLKISITRSIPFRGLYVEKGEESIIFINPQNHRSFSEFIDTVIHEYTHFLHGLEYYDQILDITGYDKHPMEQSSNIVADLLKTKCRKDIFSW